MHEILALIPARSGSKGVAHKNIATFHGKPMLAHSIEQALNSKRISRVIVSTDSEMYASIARQYGADVPFLRPGELAGDFSTDLEAFTHALEWLQRNEDYWPDICVHLRPTYPTREVGDIDRAIELLESDSAFDSVRSVVQAPETPFKMWFKASDDELSPVVPSDLVEPYNSPRQVLPPVYLQNACVDVVWSRVILEQKSMTGRRIRGMLMAENRDIDTVDQFQKAIGSGRVNLAGKRLVIDIDGVIATQSPNLDYSLAEPNPQSIAIINRLYDHECKIILFTARGFMTGVDWRELTEKQMDSWGVKYHELRFGKPAGDYYVDDRFIGLEQLDTMLDSWQQRCKKDSTS